MDVFLEIARKGYRVLPQYELAGYWIDLLVEGLDGRLAVECDGDVWHGADRYEEDMPVNESSNAAACAFGECGEARTIGMVRQRYRICGERSIGFE